MPLHFQAITQKLDEFIYEKFHFFPYHQTSAYSLELNTQLCVSHMQIINWEQTKTHCKCVKYELSCSQMELSDDL